MARLSVWMRLAFKNGGIPRRYWGRFFKILLVSTLTLPLRIAESLVFSRRVNKVDVSNPPIFVLGFARSGTTHLHNLLAQDPNLGYLSTFQGIAQNFFLLGRKRLKRIMEQGMSDQTRPMDNVKVTLDAPQEEEVALGNATHMSVIHHLTFPGLAEPLMQEYMLMGDGSELGDRRLRKWERVYMNIVRKATIDCNGKRLVLKTPANTGRIPALVRMFPGAKFVNIVRNPYVVYRSLLHMYRKVLPLYGLDDRPWNEIEEFAIKSFRIVMKKYLEDYSSIPGENLVEIKFEDLEKDPIRELESLYSKLDLPDWEPARESIERYLDGVANYKKNKFSLEQDLIDKVGEHMQFALKRWGYSLPS